MVEADAVPVSSFPARRAGACPFCGSHIRVGDPIGRVAGASRFGCGDCAAAHHVDGSGFPTIIARREEPCRLCGEVVRPGDRLSLAPFGQTVCVQCGSDPERLVGGLTTTADTGTD